MVKTPIGYKVGTIENKDRVWELSPDLITKFNLKEHQSITLKFGSLSTRVSVLQMYPEKLPDGTQMRLSKGVLKELRLPEKISLSVTPTKGLQFRLGPVIGILTFRHVVANKNFGFYLNYVSLLKNGLLYVFRSNGINTETKTIKGFYYDNFTKTWKMAEFPYPDVVLDRCYPNGYVTHTRLEKVIGKGKIFNKKTMINKFDFYTALHENRFLNKHLPETRMFLQTSDMEYFLNKYREIFLKPLNGMKGQGIATVTLADKGLVCRYMANNKAVAKKITAPDQIFDILKHTGRSGRRYIIQNAVPRMKYQGKPFCFRVVVCKNGNGRWLVPAIFAKATTTDGFLTNYSSGARFVLLKHLFNEITKHLPCNKTEFMNLLIDLSLKTAEALDHKYGPLGKLGLDIVVDTSGKPWLIEANGNPGMVPRYAQAEFPHWCYQVFQLPLSYAVYLAGFNN